MESKIVERTRNAKALHTLSDTTSIRIVSELERKNLSFTEIREKLDLSKGTLYYYLKKLIKSGLIVNYYQKRERSSEYSFYKLTPFGNQILEKLDAHRKIGKPSIIEGQKSRIGTSEIPIFWVYDNFMTQKRFPLEELPVTEDDKFHYFKVYKGKEKNFSTLSHDKWFHSRKKEEIGEKRL